MGDTIVSIDGGVTGHIYVPAGTGKPVVLENVRMEPKAAIHAKNAAPGVPYSNLRITVK